MSKIRVQMPMGTGSVSVAGHSYTADQDGVVHVDLAEHVAPLVLSGGFELNERDQPGAVSTLVGSDAFPATIELPDADDISLGDLVRQTHARTGVSVDEWNNLPQPIRDILLGYHVGTLRGEIGSTGELTEELRTARERINELEAQLDVAHSGADEETPKFADMTKAVINDWLTTNGGEALTSGTHAEHVTAAETRWAEMKA